MSNEVKIGQSFLDKAVELTGSVEKAFELALANGYSVTDAIAAGTMLKTLPESGGQVLQQIQRLSISPATLLSAASLGVFTQTPAFEETIEVFLSNEVKIGQSFLDKAVELTGSVEKAFELALANGFSITDTIAVGTMLKTLPESSSQALQQIQRLSISPATLLSPAGTELFTRIFFEEMPEEFF